MKVRLFINVTVSGQNYYNFSIIKTQFDFIFVSRFIIFIIFKTYVNKLVFLISSFSKDSITDNLPVAEISVKNMTKQRTHSRT